MTPLRTHIHYYTPHSQHQFTVIINLFVKPEKCVTFLSVPN